MGIAGRQRVAANAGEPAALIYALPPAFDEAFPKSDASYSQMNFQLLATSTV
jgi:hypothetical protein